MFYDKKAQILSRDRVSDGMGGWIDSTTPLELAVIRVAKAPVTAEVALREYGIVTTTSLKLYTEQDIPDGDIYIHFESKDYRILQNLDYGTESVLLMELM